ncbi:MAG: response regulator [Bdellovibrionota bacterium]
MLSNNEKYILLVEDNPDDEELTIIALKKGNINNEIKVVRDGVEALEFLFSATILPQVVLLDLKLPKKKGLEVLKEIRGNEKTKKLPVVVLTSSKEEEDLIKSYHLGANSYVCKPVNMEQFTMAVQQLGLYWLVLNESLT